jgi:hypothetical protein
MKQIILYTCFVLVVSALVSCSSPRIDWIPVEESVHFTFFAGKGAEDAVPLLDKELEANYDRITGDLQVTATKKFPVYVFPDIDTFHQASGQPGASATHVGTAQGIATWLVSPLNPGGALDTQTVLIAGVHEFTHALVNYVNGSLDENNYQIPIWLNEGLAGYEARQMTPDWRAAMVQKVAEGAVPSISTDLTPPDKWEQVKGFPYSITLVEYMVKEYGFDKIIAIIKAPSELEAILGFTISELDSGWREYLQEIYR